MKPVRFSSGDGYRGNAIYHRRIWLLHYGILLVVVFGCFPRTDAAGPGRTLAQQDIRPVGSTTWPVRDSPFSIQQTLVIPRGAGLVIEPGVRLEFSPGTGLIVQGALMALVRLMTSNVL